MRKSSAALLGALTLFLGAGPAAAGALESASLSFAIGALPPAVFEASGATGTATSNLSATLDEGTAFNGTTTTTIPLTAAPPLSQIQVILSGNGGLSWADAPVGAGFVGISNVKGFGGLTLLGVPLNIGVAQTTSRGDFGVNITAIGGSWTAGATTITGLEIETANPLGTAMLTGSNALTAGGGGTLTLIAPIKIITNIAGTLAAFGVLSLTYQAPEPAAALSVAAAVAALAALGLRRRKH